MHLLPSAHTVGPVYPFPPQRPYFGTVAAALPHAHSVTVETAAGRIELDPSITAGAVETLMGAVDASAAEVETTGAVEDVSGALVETEDTGVGTAEA